MASWFNSHGIKSASKEQVLARITIHLLVMKTTYPFGINVFVFLLSWVHMLFIYRECSTLRVATYLLLRVYYNVGSCSHSLLCTCRAGFCGRYETSSLLKLSQTPFWSCMTVHSKRCTTTQTPTLWPRCPPWSATTSRSPAPWWKASSPSPAGRRPSPWTGNI